MPVKFQFYGTPNAVLSDSYQQLRSLHPNLQVTGLDKEDTHTIADDPEVAQLHLPKEPASRVNAMVIEGTGCAQISGR